MGQYLHLDTVDIADFNPQTERGTLVTNPPYGERMLDIREAERLYRIMGEKFSPRKAGAMASFRRMNSLKSALAARQTSGASCITV